MVVLALHGFRQNGKLMKDKLKRLGFNDPICPDGPLLLTGEGDLRGWWKLEVPAGEKVKTYISRPHKYEGYKETIAHLKATVPLNDVTVVVGFSQGAVLASLLLHHNLLPRARKAVLLSGSPVMDESLLTKGKIHTPMLSLVGERDEVTDQLLALKLSQLYLSAELGHHTGGHVIPSDSTSKGIITRFISD